MQLTRSDFALIGTRDYVHGPSIFETFRSRALEAAGVSADSPFSFRFLRVNQTMHANGALVVAQADEPRPQWGRAAAEMLCTAGDRPWYVGLYDRESTPIARREHARERDYVRAVQLAAPFCGDATIAGVCTQGDLFQAAVEANKQVHLKSLTGDAWSNALRFRFVYCLDYACPRDLGTGTGTVRIVSEGLRDAGDYRYSLTRLVLGIGGCTSTFKLCFASKDMRGAVS